MNSGLLQENRIICRFNLKGMCRFGTRCRNSHEKPTEKLQECKASSSGGSSSSRSITTVYSVGGISVVSSKPTENQTDLAKAKENIFGPSTSTAEEAITLVQEARSSDKTCGICLDMVVNKTKRREQIFGILPNCNHCFCYTCIKKWRQSKEVKMDVAKACPECRTESDFVYRSKHWLDNEEKDEFIVGEKERMKKLPCSYFRKGRGRCPFGNTCMYLHALPNGKILDVGPPRPGRTRSQGSDSELFHQILFWLNDEDLDDAIADEYDLDLSDPTIAMQYYDRGDFRRYMAIDRLMNGSDDEDSEYDFLFL